jgi:fibronectin-binding autotransporter adhesin
MNGETALFSDGAAGPSPISVELDTTVNPAGVIVNNTLMNYTISGNGGIAGTNSLTKSGPNALTLNVANTYSGGTFLNGGTLTITADNNLGNPAGPLVIGSATLHSSSADVGVARPVAISSNATFTVDPGTTLSLTNGFANTLTASGTINLNGGGTLSLAGGTVIITNNNEFDANNATITVAGATVNIGGKFVLGNATANPMTMNVTSGTFNYVAANWFAMADAGLLSTLNVSGGNMNFATVGGMQLLFGNKGNAVVNVTGGSVHISSDPTIYLGGHPQYAANSASGTLNISDTGLVTVDASTNASFVLGSSQAGVSGTAGTINLQTGGTLATGRNIVRGNVSDSGYLYFSGGTLKITANITNFLQGLTQVAIDGNGAIIDDGGFAVSIPELLADNGGGFLTKKGSGTLYLDGANTYTGPTVVTAGALGGSGTIGGDLTVQSGAALAPGDSGTTGTLAIGGNLTMQGDVLIDVNKSLAQANDVVTVSGVLTNAGTGSVIVNNLGPILAVGDKFTLFSRPVVNGAALRLSGGNATWTNNLVVDGSISVLSVIPVPPSATGVRLLPDRNISLTVTGAVGTVWSLHATNNVAARLPWPAITNGTVTVSPFTVQDLTATNSTGKFYYFSAP